MKTSLETVSLFTVPSIHVSQYSPPMPNAYSRVVGISLPSSPDELWSRMDIANDVSRYDVGEVSTEKLVLPSPLAYRLGSFFNRFFVEPPEVRSGRGFEDPRVRSYNCHRFGFWMEDAPEAQDFELPNPPDQVVVKGKRAHGPLALGVHGVVGMKVGRRGSAVHSVVGLGEDRLDCLQVLGAGGFMGIDSYENVMRYNKYLTQGMPGHEQLDLFFR